MRGGENCEKFYGGKFWMGTFFHGNTASNMPNRNSVLLDYLNVTIRKEKPKVNVCDSFPEHSFEICKSERRNIENILKDSKQDNGNEKTLINCDVLENFVEPQIGALEFKLVEIEELPLNYRQKELYFEHLHKKSGLHNLDDPRRIELDTFVMKVIPPSIPLSEFEALPCWTQFQLNIPECFLSFMESLSGGMEPNRMTKFDTPFELSMMIPISHAFELVQELRFDFSETDTKEVDGPQEIQKQKVFQNLHLLGCLSYMPVPQRTRTKSSISCFKPLKFSTDVDKLSKLFQSAAFDEPEMKSEFEHEDLIRPKLQLIEEVEKVVCVSFDEAAKGSYNKAVSLLPKKIESVRDESLPEISHSGSNLTDLNSSASMFFKLKNKQSSSLSKRQKMSFNSIEVSLHGTYIEEILDVVSFLSKKLMTRLYKEKITNVIEMNLVETEWGKMCHDFIKLHKSRAHKLKHKEQILIQTMLELEILKMFQITLVNRGICSSLVVIDSFATSNSETMAIIKSLTQVYKKLVFQGKIPDHPKLLLLLEQSIELVQSGKKLLISFNSEISYHGKSSDYFLSISLF